MNFVTFDDIRKQFDNKSVAIVGSGPSVLNNEKNFIDSHDVVVRVNNFKLTSETGNRTDVFYSFFGASIRTPKLYLYRTRLCMCKCPNEKIESPWHEQNNKQLGADFRKIYERRKGWWFCDTYIPTLEEFNQKRDLLDGHIPSTGFSCVLDISQFDCEIYLTGFDFFSSKIHNVNEKWREGDPNDPIRHVPEKEKKYLMDNKSRFIFDDTLNDFYLQEQKVS